jgi:4a-hydroxytetrahydrobiopterin dehydratase
MNNWIEEENKLTKTFKFKTFGDAMAWMVKASYMIEKMDHHPEWTNIYNKVMVTLTTHDAGNKITEKDTVVGIQISEVSNFSRLSNTQRIARGALIWDTKKSEWTRAYSMLPDAISGPTEVIALFVSPGAK